MPPLHSYFHLGHVLLIGSALVKDTTLSAFLAKHICGAKSGESFEDKSRQKIGSVKVTYYKDAKILDNPAKKESFVYYDAIILGLNPDPKAKLKPIDQIKTLVEVLEKVYQHFTGIALNRPLPQVLVFPAGIFNTPFDFPWTELSQIRFLHLLPQIGSGRKSYHDFKYTLIRMLKDSVANSLGLSFPRGFYALDTWLSQFDDKDQPFVLRVMRYFRYYSAESQRRLLEGYLNSHKERSADKTKTRLAWLTYLGRPNKSAPAVLTLAAKTSWARGILKKDGREGLKTKSYDDLVPELGKAIMLPQKGDKGIDIFLVDDVIGSGGQLVSYLNSFLNDLWDVVRQSSNHRWKKTLKNNVIDALGNNASPSKIRLHAVFIMGVKSEEFEKLFADELKEVKTPEQLSGARTIEGELKHKWMLSDEDSEPVELVVYVSVIDYTQSLFELCEKELVPGSMIDILNQYTFITHPREREHWLQFEPFGWKDCGALIATHMNCPGNTLPIVWGDRESGRAKAWLPLFPRYFNPWHDGSDTPDQIIVKINFNKSRASSEKRKMVAYILQQRTRMSEHEIAQLVGLKSQDIKKVLAKVDSESQTNHKYREKLRKLFRLSN